MNEEKGQEFEREKEGVVRESQSGDQGVVEERERVATLET